MTPVYIVTIVFTAIIVVIAIVSSTFLTWMRLRHGGIGTKDKTNWNEETRLIQQMHQDLTKMEKRIETLETILMEDFGKDTK
jgi:phage shock protein B